MLELFSPIRATIIGDLEYFSELFAKIAFDTSENGLPKDTYRNPSHLLGKEKNEEDLRKTDAPIRLERAFEAIIVGAIFVAPLFGC